MWGIAYFAGHYWLNLRIVNITVLEAPNFLLILKLGTIQYNIYLPYTTFTHGKKEEEN